MKKIIEITFEQLKSHFENLGFTECIHYENSQAFDFYKTINDVQYYIGIVYYKNKSNLYFGRVVHSYIISKEVNRILEKFTETMGTREHVLIKFPLYSKNIDDPFLNQLKTLPLNTKDSFEAAKQAIKAHIETYTLPFFDKVPNLQTINDEVINKYTHDEYSDYIKGKSNFKVLIIMKLCNNPDYGNFKNTLIDIYNHAIQVDEQEYKPDYDSFQQLLLYLESDEF